MEDREPGGRLSSDLAALEGQLEAIESEAAALVEGLGREQLTWRPAPGRWSIAECLDHLNAVGYKVLPRLDDLIAQAESRAPDSRALESRATESPQPYRPGLLARLLIRWIEPPYRLKVKVPKTYAAPSPDDPERVKRDFLELQSELIKRLYGAEGVDLNRVKAPSPASRYLKMSLGEWLSFLAAHERRHLWQARQVREHPEFPGA